LLYQLNTAANIVNIISVSLIQYHSDTITLLFIDVLLLFIIIIIKLFIETEKHRDIVFVTNVYPLLRLRVLLPINQNSRLVSNFIAPARL